MPEEQQPAPAALKPAFLTAANMLALRRSRAPARVPEAVVLTHQTDLFRALAPRFRTRSQRGLSAELRPVPATGGRLAAAGKLGVGGPATAILVEELSVLGVKQIVAVDIAASIDPARRSGAVVVAPSAHCGDGTSPHYAPGRPSVPADERLVDRLLDALSAAGLTPKRGSVWSTDAPYRETARLIEEARGRGAALIDMETAALYAAGAALGIATAAVLVVADEIFDTWRPPADARLLQARLTAAAAAVKRCLLP